MGEMVVTRAWRKSTRCETAACVEVATDGPLVGLRNSAEPGIALMVDGAAWTAFVRAVKDGEFDGR